MTQKTSPKTVILGAGLAGLSTAYHMRPFPVTVIERENEIGGTARSFYVDGFTFDFTGHLLHLHHPYTKQLIRKLLKGRFYTCLRKAWIYSHGTYTRYPFQANTFGLPPHVVDECVTGFWDVAFNRAPSRDFSRWNFHDWCHRTFGRGISKYFMVPYNEKLYQTPAVKMSADWCGPFVPTPNVEDVIRGALIGTDKKFGYNTSFLYPKEGGIQQLAQGLGAPLKKHIRLNSKVDRIRWRRKEVVLSSGETLRYTHLVSCIPLVELLKRMDPIPADVARAMKRLKWVGITCVNIGVRRPRISEKSWVYFPEKKYPFYRVGFPMNFTPHVVPKGCSSMYVEVPMRYSRRFSKKILIQRVRRGLIQCGILKKSDQLPVVQILPIPYAYVVFNQHRPKSLQTIFRFLEKNRIQSIGRYGAWKYSFMEEAILDGKAAAAKIRDAKRPDR